MFKNNRNLFIIALIAIVNALGYGIIIPVLYSYSQRFGMSDFENGLLFSIFSLCQFISTPIIGRLSDKYGRKPLLIISISGTALSFFLAAFAPSAIFLFIARALDGITAGNIPVASAIISDTTKPKDRAIGLGIIGASFGFGFVFGPAIAAVTVGIGPAVPFLIAGIVSFTAVFVTWRYLPEANMHLGQVKHSPLFNFKHLITAVTDDKVGITLVVSLVASFAFSLFIYTYQPMSVKVLHLSATVISINFTIYGIVGLLTQVLIIPRVVKAFGEKKALLMSLGITVCTFLAFYAAGNYFVFLVASIIQAVANGFTNPMIQSLLSKATDEVSQGTIQGLNASYISLGMIFGPIAGGIIATYSITAPFILGSVCMLMCFMLSRRIKTHIHLKENAF